ncbi:MAG TPA: Ig-like domain-containing protein, partial [Candidatus Kapabacteria bacterium]|nr:Ig-like domain-containing protein [Candidatus Kapabacteria bacterium]
MKRITFLQRNRLSKMTNMGDRLSSVMGRSFYFVLFAFYFLLYPGCQYNIAGNPDVNLLAVHVSPDSAAVATNGSLVLTASIKDFLHEGTVTWSIEEPNAGTIVSTGLTATYIAPAGLSLSLSVVHIRLSADEDPTRYVVCPITIVLPKDADTLFEVSPQTVWMLTNDPQQNHTQQFTID